MEMESVLCVLPGRVRLALEALDLPGDGLREIRLRIGQPVLVKWRERELLAGDAEEGGCIVSREDLQEMLSYISHFSLYAYEEEMRQGFLTIEGGHRIGLCGQVIVEDGRVKNLRYVSSVHVRVAHEKPGCADAIFPFITHQKKLLHTLIISPPGCGKTTLLRDAIRQLSDGNRYVDGMSVGVVDERSEIAGAFQGKPQNHLGMRTDVLDGCPKAEGMLMLIRAMGPQALAVDEIGGETDARAVAYAMQCGCRMLATVHGDSVEDVRSRSFLGKLMQKRRFERYVVLSGVGRIGGVYDAEGRSVNGEC